jgi:hypothetical protein
MFHYPVFDGCGEAEAVTFCCNLLASVARRRITVIGCYKLLPSVAFCIQTVTRRDFRGLRSRTALAAAARRKMLRLGALASGDAGTPVARTPTNGTYETGAIGYCLNA